MDDVRLYLDHETLRFVRFKAGQIAGKYGFHRDELEDIQQILIVDCLQRMPRFDSHRGNPRIFAQLIVKRRIASLIQSHTARCRDYRLSSESLDAPENNANFTHSPLIEKPARNNDRAESGSRFRSFERIVVLRCDVERTIAALPAELQRICRLLMFVDRMAEVAKVIGVSRATLHRRMVTIRTIFAQAGLSGYIRSRNVAEEWPDRTHLDSWASFGRSLQPNLRQGSANEFLA